MSFDNFIQYPQPQERGRTSQRYIQIYWLSLWQNKLPNKFITCSLFLIFLVFIVLHLISLRQVSFQMCQVDNLPFGVFHGSPSHVDPLPSVDLNRVSDISPAKMDLFRVSRELQFEVCICGEPSVSPQSSRAGEHFFFLFVVDFIIHWNETAI